MDLEFEQSAYRLKHWPGWDLMDKLDLEASCWEDILRARQCHFRVINRVQSLEVLQLLAQEIITQGGVIQECAHAAQVVPRGSNRRATIAAADAGKKFLVDSSRVTAALATVHRCMDLLQGTDEVDEDVAESEPSGFVCAGQFCRGAVALVGWRYHCQACDIDLCSKCYLQHNLRHELRLHRVEDAARNGLVFYAVEDVMGHIDTPSGRKYLISWVGHDDQSLHLKSDLNNDAIVDQ